MSRLKRPIVVTSCEAQQHAMPTERIIEIIFPDDRGCLVSARIRDDGAYEVVVYRQDRGVRTWCETRVRARTKRAQRRSKIGEAA